MAQLAVLGIALHPEVHIAVLGNISVAGVDQILHDIQDLLDVLGSPGLDGGLFAVEAGGILEVLGLKALSDLLHGGALFLSLLNELVVDIGDVEMCIRDRNDLEQRRANGSNELSEEAKHQIDQLLKSKFRPEFLNRLDEIVYYKSLTKDEMRRIVNLQLQDLRKRMDEGKHLKLEVTTAAKDFIIDSAYDSVYGARPIKRFIQSRVETLIAKAIIQGSYTEGLSLIHI